MSDNTAVVLSLAIVVSPFLLVILALWKGLKDD
jgi:hypothetical protein